MTLTAYAAKVTEILTADLGPDFEFPGSFDADVQACFARRETPEAAAEKLAAEYVANA